MLASKFAAAAALSWALIRSSDDSDRGLPWAFPESVPASGVDVRADSSPALLLRVLVIPSASIGAIGDSVALAN